MQEMFWVLTFEMTSWRDRKAGLLHQKPANQPCANHVTAEAWTHRGHSNFCREHKRNSVQVSAWEPRSSTWPIIHPHETDLGVKRQDGKQMKRLKKKQKNRFVWPVEKCDSENISGCNQNFSIKPSFSHSHFLLWSKIHPFTLRFFKSRSGWSCTEAQDNLAW